MTEQTTEQTRTGLVGSLRRDGDRGTVRMQDRYDTDPGDLWDAITDPERLARWIGTVEGDLRAGGAFRARFTSTWEGPGRVDVCDPPRRLLVTLGVGEDDENELEAVLTPDGDGTVLVIEERGFGLDEVAAHGAGWQAHVEDLAAHLAGRERTDWRTRWQQLSPRYRELAAEL
jgi:uncharacterized protein YndB with AHSA1/START domain